MVIDGSQYKSLDFSKYNRVFIFGCSFTNFESWITWANILSIECSNAIIYNTAQPGGGNLFISCTLAACNKKYSFNKNDLILVMWSTHCRDDRYKEDRWITKGNVWGQGLPDSYLKEYACIRGYVVRDYALMSITEGFFSNLECDSIFLKSVEIDLDKVLCGRDLNLNDVKLLYKEEIGRSSVSMNEIIGDKFSGFPISHRYYYPELGHTYSKFEDRHPTPKMYLEYLKHLNFPISPKTHELINNHNQIILETDNFQELKVQKRNFLNKHVLNNIENPFIV